MLYTHTHTETWVNKLDGGGGEGVRRWGETTFGNCQVFSGGLSLPLPETARWDNFETNYMWSRKLAVTRPVVKSAMVFLPVLRDVVFGGRSGCQDQKSVTKKVSADHKWNSFLSVVSPTWDAKNFLSPLSQIGKILPPRHLCSQPWVCVHDNDVIIVSQRWRRKKLISPAPTLKLKLKSPWG